MSVLFVQWQVQKVNSKYIITFGHDLRDEAGSAVDLFPALPILPYGKLLHKTLIFLETYTGKQLTFRIIGYDL